MFILKTLILSCVVIAASPDGDDSKPSSSAAPSPTLTESISATDEMFQQAFRLEAEGDFAGRDAMFRKILDVQPNNDQAHWQLGEVYFRSRWLSPEAVADEVIKDPVLAKYREARSRFTDTGSNHFSLAKWCRRHDLSDERQAHLLAAVELEPRNARLQRALGRSQYQHRWMTSDEITDLERLEKQAVTAHETWKPKLLKLRKQFESRSPAQHESAYETLMAVRDPLAITALEEVFSTHSEKSGLLAVEALGRTPHQESTNSLVRHAVWSNWPEVRTAAIEQLRYRDSLHYVPDLIEHLRPTRSGETWVRLSNGRPVNVWFWQDFNKNYVDAVDMRRLHYWDTLLAGAGTDRSTLSRRIEATLGLKGMTNVSRTREAVVLRGVKAADQENQHRLTNTQAALAQLTNQQWGEDHQAWRTWWAKANHLYYDPSSYSEPDRPTFYRRTDNYNP